jgi:hypothetical protein
MPQPGERDAIGIPRRWIGLQCRTDRIPPEIRQNAAKETGAPGRRTSQPKSAQAGGKPSRRRACDEKFSSIQSHEAKLPEESKKSTRRAWIAPRHLNLPLLGDGCGSTDQGYANQRYCRW